MKPPRSALPLPRYVERKALKGGLHRGLSKSCSGGHPP